MSLVQAFLSRNRSKAMAIVLGAVASFSPGLGEAEPCSLSATHAELSFPVEHVHPDWVCRLQVIIGSSTTVTKVGPVRAAMSEVSYRYLLDHPPVATTLIKRLGLGPYMSEERGPSRYWGDDGEGTKGIVQLVYEDRTSRIYYLEGSHESRLLPNVTGKAVVFLRVDPVRGVSEQEAMDSTMVAYTKLDNRVLSGLVSMLHPLVGRIVKSRLQKGVETVDKLGQAMRQDPQRVWRAATIPTPLADNHVGFLKTVLEVQHNADMTNSLAPTTP